MQLSWFDVRRRGPLKSVIMVSVFFGIIRHGGLDSKPNLEPSKPSDCSTMFYWIPFKWELYYCCTMNIIHNSWLFHLHPYNYCHHMGQFIPMLVDEREDQYIFVVGVHHLWTIPHTDSYIMFLAAESGLWRSCCQLIHQLQFSRVHWFCHNKMANGIRDVCWTIPQIRHVFFKNRYPTHPLQLSTEYLLCCACRTDLQEMQSSWRSQVPAYPTLGCCCWWIRGWDLPTS